MWDFFFFFIGLFLSKSSCDWKELACSCLAKILVVNWPAKELYQLPTNHHITKLLQSSVSQGHANELYCTLWLGVWPEHTRTHTHTHTHTRLPLCVARRMTNSFLATAKLMMKRKCHRLWLVPEYFVQCKCDEFWWWLNVSFSVQLKLMNCNALELLETILRIHHLNLILQTV